MHRFHDRTRILKGQPKVGDFVLYWMRTAVRVDHNPALITALELSNKLHKPLIVYHAISERYPYASDRHHTFILEGARSIAPKMKDLGIPYFLHVEREGHRGSHLETLTRQASVVVTEDMPIPFLAHWTENLAQRTQTTMYLVDTDCVVPMRQSTKAPTRAFQFRDQFKESRQYRLDNMIFPKLETLLAFPNWKPELPFEPVDPTTCDIPTLIGKCAIDHSILPVPQMEGGSDAAQKRWTTFKEKKLTRYHKDRNDPLKDGVSRLSAYLHYGMISSFQLAKESTAYGAGGEKYRDELLIWRELAHHWCAHTPNPQHWMSLPRWARDTLEQHQTDTRAYTTTWQTLRWAETTSELWNLCQQSLNLHGELHNNVRMTWGKQLIEWLDNPRKALRMTLDLNNRFALDGRDPSSYGGILWCFGLFDRPFTPEKNLWGTVRERTAAVHSKRLNLDKYKTLVHKSPFKSMPVQINTAPFVTCLLHQSLKDYDCSVYYQGTVTELGLPTNVGTSHQSRLLISSWVEAGWVTRENDSIKWTELGKEHWNRAWKSILEKAQLQLPSTNLPSNTCRMHQKDYTQPLKDPIDQYQAWVHLISTHLTPALSVSRSQSQQIQLW